MAVPPTPAAPAASAEPARLLAEAASAGSVLWLHLPDGGAHLAWHAWDGERLLLVTGPGEQRLPPLPVECTVTLRSAATRAAMLRVDVRIEALPPSGDAWAAAAAALREARLNAPAQGVLERWGSECTVYALSPLDGGITTV